MNWMESLALWIKVYALIVSLVGVVLSTRKLRHFWRTRHLRRVWGFKDGDSVVLVCSELEEPEARQHVEPREFIYSLKYGDVDAFFEVITTLLRLYPAIKLRVMSSGEAASTRLDLGRHLVLIGGPDYNKLAERVLSWNLTQWDYRSPYAGARSSSHPEEIVLYDKVNDKEYCYATDAQDFGYFERVVNLHNPGRWIVLVGGCHTIGVTGAVKAFSMADSEEGEIPPRVLENAALVSKRLGKAKTFSVLVSVERVGQTISVPVVRPDDVMPRGA